MKKIVLFLFCCLCVLYVKAQSEMSGLHFQGGNFKIVQFTDVHYVSGSDDSKGSIQRMEKTLDSEKPDLVVFSGDVVTCKPQKKGWDEILEIAVKRKLPWAVVLGNHDDEYDWTRDEIMSYITTKPGCLSQKGPDYLKGFGNFVLQIKGENQKTAALLYCMDSNAYSTITGIKGYGWFGFDQIDWYRKESAFFTKKNDGNPLPALAFFHIPLPEYSLLSDTSKHCVVYGTRKEKECSGVLNTGMYTAMLECGDVMGTFVGHDHDNDYIGNLYGICLAYGRFSGSKTTYTSIGSGSRVIVLKEGKREFQSWLLNEKNEKLYPVVYPDSFK